MTIPKYFNYIVKRNLADHELSDLGLKGWSLVSIIKSPNTGEQLFYFKRVDRPLKTNRNTDPTLDQSF